jgi:YidC/Oxa1 family membrane protein insertase
MNPFQLIWNSVLITPITNVLIGFYRLFEILHVPWPLGWAIICMTITARIVLYPLMNAQLKSAKKMADLKPHLDEINAKHKNDKQALQQAQMQLYKDHGVNPAAGCLPLLVQMPILIALYNVFYQVFTITDMTQVISKMNAFVYFPWLKLTTIDLSFFGTNLGLKPSQWQTHGWWMLAIPVITGGLQWYQQKIMMPASKPSAVSRQPSANQNAKNIALKNEKGKTEEKPEPDQAAEMQKQMAIISPLMFGFFALQFPLGLALYWNVFGLFGIMQQLAINKQK